MTPPDDVQALGVAIKIMRILASLPDTDARRRVIECAIILLKGRPDDAR